MLTALLITLLPTLLAYLLLPKIGLVIKSMYLRLSFAWFTGLFFFTNITFLVALLIKSYTTDVLMKASFITLLLTFAIAVLLHTDVQQLLSNIQKKKPLRQITKADIIITFFSLLFASLFFIPHIQLFNGAIYTSPIYWDFHWHMQIIQGFVAGDNFPPENSAYAGIPMLYHFFGDFVMAIYQSVGLTITQSITYPSILFLFILLMTIVGTCNEYLKSKLVGFFAVLFTITSSSGHFIYYFLQNRDIPLPLQFINILVNDTHPWYVSHIKYSPFNYNGTFFNLFYFLEERHLLLGSIFLLFSFFIIYNRKTLSNRVLLFIGICMGLFLFWHTYVTMYVLLIIGLLLFFDKYRAKTIYLFSGFFIIFLLQYLAIINTINTYTGFIKDTTSYPILNFDFAGESPDKSLMGKIVFAGSFYVFAYGIKLFLFPISLYFLYKKNKYLAKLFFFAIIPIFIVINSLQIFASGVGENHKFLLNMNILINIVTAYGVFLCFKKHKKLIGYILLFLLTISGIIEHMPFINSVPSTYFSDYSAQSYAKDIQKHIPRDAVTLSRDEKQFYLAGRKLFIGNAVLPTDGIDKKRRMDIANEIYHADTKTFCILTQSNKIDYVVFFEGENAQVRKQSKFILHNYQHKRYFVDVRELCSDKNNL